jgi:hypothetical protein
VHTGEFKPGKTSLANRLLEHEFAAWFKQVADDCEQRWNVRPKAPMSGGASGYSDAYEVSLIDAENQKTALGAVVDPWYMALSILAFTDADTGTTADNGSHVPTYTGYARKSVAGTDMPAATSGSGQAANTSAIIFAACTNLTSTILAFANTSALTVGTLRKWGDCASTVVSTTQTPPQFAYRRVRHERGLQRVVPVGCAAAGRAVDGALLARAWELLGQHRRCALGGLG